MAANRLRIELVLILIVGILCWKVIRVTNKSNKLSSEISTFNYRLNFIESKSRNMEIEIKENNKNREIEGSKFKVATKSTTKTSAVQKGSQTYKEVVNNLQTNRQLWQICMNNLPAENTDRSLRNYLSLNSYLAAWLYTIESLTKSSSAMRQMTDQLNVMLCNIGSFVLDDHNFHDNRLIDQSESFQGIVSELGTTYRTTHMIMNMQEALSDPDNNKTPAMLAFEAYVNSDLSKRHGWLLQNSIKVAMKMGLPTTQEQFMFQLTGFNQLQNIDVASTHQLIIDEFHQAVYSMKLTRNYLRPVLSGDTDVVLFEKWQNGEWNKSINLTNTRNSHLNVCGIQWNDKDKLSVDVETGNNIFSTRELGTHCKINMCR